MIDTEPGVIEQEIQYRQNDMGIHIIPWPQRMGKKGKISQTPFLPLKVAQAIGWNKKIEMSSDIGRLFSASPIWVEAYHSPGR